MSLMEEQIADAVETWHPEGDATMRDEHLVAEPIPFPLPVPVPTHQPRPRPLPSPPPDAQPYQVLAHAMAQYIVDHPGCMMHGPVAHDATGRDVYPEDPTAVRFCMIGLAYHVAERQQVPSMARGTMESVWEQMAKQFAPWDYSMANWYEGTPCVSDRKRNTAETLGVLMLLAQGEPVPADD